MYCDNNFNFSKLFPGVTFKFTGRKRAKTGTKLTHQEAKRNTLSILRNLTKELTDLETQKGNEKEKEKKTYKPNENKPNLLKIIDKIIKEIKKMKNY